MKRFFRVVSQTEPVAVQSQKAEGGQMAKCSIVLQEINGRYADTLVATMLGKDATLQFYAGDLVFASLRFTVREYNGQNYQDIVVSDIVKINK